VRRSKRLLRLAAALLGVSLIAAACDPNPATEEAYELGSNGGDPVIIVAGTFSPAIANEAFLGNAIEATGHTHCVFELKGDDNLGNLPGTQPIELSAGALALFVEDVLVWSGETQADLVGHSQGALAARYYIKNFGGAAKVDTFVSLAGPNEGTDVIGLITFLTGPLLAPFGVGCETIWPCVQMEEGSTFLTDLNAGDMTPGPVDYYAFYTDNDELVWYWGSGPFGIPVVKFDNAELGPRATNVQVDDMCPFRVVGHVGMIIDPVPIHMTLDALADRPIDVPFLTCLLPPVVI
jgi:hypothetical protein